MRKALYLSFIVAAVVSLLWVSCHSNESKDDRQGKDSLLHSAMLQGVTDSIRQYPDSPGLYFERGGILYTMKEYEMSGKDIQKAIALDPMRVDYYIALGEIQLATDKYNVAQEAFEKALQVDHSNLMARLQLAYTLFHRSAYKETILQTDTLLKQDNTLAEAYGLQSQAYNALHDTAKALAVMQHAVLLAPGDYDVLMAMGDLLLKANDTKALPYYQRAAMADTTQAEPLYCIGLFYEKSRRTDSAIVAYRKCINRDAYYLDAYLKLGHIYEGKNDWENALKIYKLATDIDPRSSAAFYGRGLSFEKLNQLENALNDYENAYSLERTNTKAEAAVNRLRNQISTSKK